MCQSGIIISVTIATTAIHFVHHRTIIQEDVGTTCHRIATISGTIYLSKITLVVLLHRNTDVNVGVTGDAAVMVSTINSIIHQSILTLIVDAGHISVTESRSTGFRVVSILDSLYLIAFSSTKESIHMDGWCRWHIDTSITNQTFTVAGSIHIVQMALEQIDCRTACSLKVRSSQSSVGASAKDIGGLEVFWTRPVIHEYVTLLLHGVIVRDFIRRTLTTAQNNADLIINILNRIKIDKGIGDKRLG